MESAHRLGQVPRFGGHVRRCCHLPGQDGGSFPVSLPGLLNWLSLAFSWERPMPE